MKKNTLLIFLAFFVHIELTGKPLWVSVDNSNSNHSLSITTIESTLEKYKAKIEIHGFYDNKVSVEGTVYHQLRFDEPGTLNFIGEPALPIISRLIALPRGEKFKVNIINEKWSDTIFVGQVIPSQESIHEKEKALPFARNESVYERNEYEIDNFYIGNLNRWRGVDNRVLNICPFKYFPKEGKVSILKDFVVEITFDGVVNNNSLKSNDMYLFLNKINTKVDEEPKIRASRDSYDYLIIAGNITGILECQALADFQKWKAFKGYKTKLVTTNTTGTTAAQIKQYISTEYSNGIKYVLFIGDSNKIPLYNYYNSALSETIKSDYWYGCMDGNNDVEADICIGRFSTNNLSELTNMVNKTITYESKVCNFGKEVLLVANYQGAPYKYQGCSETIRTAYYTEPACFTTAYGASDSVGGNNATNAFVVNQINANKNIINYRGHGDYNQWWQWTKNLDNFYDSQINSLNNTTNDVYFCVACQNGNIHNQTCFMETFMRSNHGAVGMIAATEDTYTNVNHIFDQYLFYKLLNNQIYNIGNLNLVSHIACIGSTTGIEYHRSVSNAFSYLCGCDPSLEILTDNTATFNDYALSLNGQFLTIDNGSIGEYKVSVVNESGELSFILNSMSNSCTFTVPTENFYIVLNKHNYVPRIIYVNVTDDNIQNKIFNNNIDNYYIKDATISAGYDVTISVPYGNVSVESGSKLTISNENDVVIKNGFECKFGGELEIK